MTHTCMVVINLIKENLVWFRFGILGWAGDKALLIYYWDTCTVVIACMFEEKVVSAFTFHTLDLRFSTSLYLQNWSDVKPLRIRVLNLGFTYYKKEIIKKLCVE